MSVQSEQYFSALLADYTATRDDERELMNQQAALFGVVIAALGVFAALSVSENEGKLAIPPLVLAGLPMIPMSLIFLLQLIGSQATARSFYARSLEREIRAHISSSSTVGGYPSLRPMLYREMMDTLSSLSGGRRIPRFLTILIILTIAVTFISLVVWTAWDFSVFLKLAMAGLYIPLLTMVTVEAVSATIYGRTYFKRLIAETGVRSRRPLTPRTQPPGSPDRGRSLVSYLILPRPLDLPKAAFFLIGALLIGALDRDVSRYPNFWWQVAVLAFLGEFIIYQCRYQLNDIRGLWEDIASPMAAQRGRIPGVRSGTRPTWIVAVVMTAMVVRLYLGVLICALPFISFFHHFVPMLASIFVLAALYETLRGIERRSTTVSGIGFVTTCPKWVVYATLALVSLGYPLRTLLGMLLPGTGTYPDRDIPGSWTSVALPVGWSPMVTVVLYAASIGLIFVTMTWCLEGGGYVTAKITTAVPPVHLYRSDIVRKPHLLVLLRQTGSTFQPTASTQPGDFDGKAEKWLRHPGRATAAWKLALVFASALGAAVAAQILDDKLLGVDSVLLSLSAIVSAVSYAIIRPKVTATWLTWIAVLATLVSAAVQVYLAIAIGQETGAAVNRICLAIAALAGPVLVYLFFEHQSHTTLKTVPPIFTGRFWKNVGKALLRVLIGRETADTL
ncbi:hypothetical protein [Nocardia sp. NPDC005366]|uniref:hypothetical protein n=1 Tax=Nocardia sp. NPDC005366 TaxID=3156878 RepID=UPI0033AFEADB